MPHTTDEPLSRPQAAAHLAAMSFLLFFGAADYAMPPAYGLLLNILASGGAVCVGYIGIRRGSGLARLVFGIVSVVALTWALLLASSILDFVTPLFGSISA